MRDRAVLELLVHPASVHRNRQLGLASGGGSAFQRRLWIDHLLGRIRRLALGLIIEGVHVVAQWRFVRLNCLVSILLMNFQVTVDIR